MKKYKVFGHPWHISHQYGLLKFPEFEWDWLIQYKRPYGIRARGDIAKDFNVNWVTHYEKGKYDFAVLHFDQQCFEPSLWEKGKGVLIKELKQIITDIPIICICHGTPYYPEKFPAKNEFGEDCDGISQELIDIAKKETKGMYVIMNSKKAAEQWGFGTPIWHGLSEEFYDLPKEPRVITMISPAGLDKYYDRAFLNGIREALAEEGINLCQITVDWLANDFNDYRNFLGRSLIYINPTKESPMPRSRTEAMLSGCCVLTTPWQDADQFIEDGVNGFIIKERNPQWVVDKVKYLFDHYDEAIRIGKQGKKTAQEIFNYDRYRAEWLQFVENAINDFKNKNIKL